LEKESEKRLKEKVKVFMDNFLPTIRFEHIDLFDTLRGIHFLPVDKNVYLKIQCFINSIENTFPKIKYSTFLYRDHLVWSGLEQEDMRILYKFLGTSLCHDSIEDEAKQPIKVNNVFPLFRTLKGYCTGMNGPDVFVASSNSPLKLIIFQLHDMICVFLMENEEDSGMFLDLEELIVKHSDFLPLLEDTFNSKKQRFEDQYRYLYFNHQNFALKTSIPEKGAVLPKDIMKMLNDMHSDFERSAQNVSEVLVRTQNDRWIVGRKSDQREFYVIFDNKNAHLIEINEEVKKLGSTYFQNIFLET